MYLVTLVTFPSSQNLSPDWLHRTKEAQIAPQPAKLPYFRHSDWMGRSLTDFWELTFSKANKERTGVGISCFALSLLSRSLALEAKRRQREHLASITDRSLDPARLNSSILKDQPPKFYAPDSKKN